MKGKPSPLRPQGNRDGPSRESQRKQRIRKNRKCREVPSIRKTFLRQVTENLSTMEKVEVVNRRIIRIHTDFWFLDSAAEHRLRKRRGQRNRFRQQKTAAQRSENCAQGKKRFNSFHRQNLRGLDWSNIARRRRFSRGRRSPEGARRTEADGEAGDRLSPSGKRRITLPSCSRGPRRTDGCWSDPRGSAAVRSG